MADVFGEIVALWARSIRRARLAAGLTQAELADAVPVTSQTVSRWERGEVVPPDSTKARLAELLNVPLAELFAWGDPVDTGS